MLQGVSQLKENILTTYHTDENKAESFQKMLYI